MSDITSSIQDTYREFCILALGAAMGLRNRLEQERGQTAAEYMGILLVVAVIIGALIASGLHHKIADTANGMVDKIAGGNENR
ncbi:MAG: hypothetical protein QOC68_2853 [Solirubrobacteraceae bacterium]|jgi:uncharacterized membrane protein required for colicin V production|nr:hypothetical protein [Solirubrobacteraceae bacterium]